MSKNIAEIRQTFLDFFQKREHYVETSSSLVPHNDPTLLFTNAGMNQFKNFFLGIERPTHRRVTTAQRCLRAGGKHNDLENVGYTARHHTFFEMLGNFSFGDYFKKEAITAAWELLTSDAWFALPKERLWITVYESDDESYAIWENEVGVPSARIIRIGDNQGARYASDNFWQMGSSGPCGPCSEIFYDHGEAIAGGPPGSATAEGDRYVEIWNLVFMQFNRQPDGTLQPLPTPCVDTGMGLERIAAVLQGVHSNYHTDVFRALIEKTAEITQTTDLSNPSLCIIADHIRASAFLIADGVIPSNEGRGYVLRRIIRRAVRHGQKLGIKLPFFYQLTAPLIAVMGGVAHEVSRQQAIIEQRLKSEEQQFIDNLQRSVALLADQLATLKQNKLSGVTAFKLYDTYGLPLDLTIDICREHNVSVDTAEFDQAMASQRQRAQRASQFTVDHNQLLPIDYTTLFCGYEQTQCLAEVVGLRYRGKQGEQDKEVAMINAGEEAIVFLTQTPFYGAAGGQVGDKGHLTAEDAIFTVCDTQRYGQTLAHLGHLTQGQLSLGDRVNAQIDNTNRQAIRLNHSATHLLQAALRQILGEHVLQKGSSVSAGYLRFDFSHFAALTSAQRRKIEQLVNAQIRHNDLITTEILDLATAKATGAMALFEEQYGDQVRVLTIGKFSTELCGGTHATRTGDIGLFHILSESGISTGIRRIEAVTGEIALQHLQLQQQRFLQAASLVKDNSGQQLVEKVQSLLENKQQLEKKVQHLQKKLAIRESIKLMNDIITIKNVKLIVREVHNIEADSLKDIVDNLKQRLSSVVILLATYHQEKVYLIAGVTQDLTQRITATELINRVAQQVGGKGGGRPELAQATGNDVNAVPDALASAVDWMSTKF